MSLFPDIVMATHLNAVPESPPTDTAADDRYGTSERNKAVRHLPDLFILLY